MTGREIWKEYYPVEWHDDQSMDVLFSLFRQNREINPHSWDKKLRFWSDMIKNELLFTKKVFFDASQLRHAFKRKGSLPKCLPTVLQEMIRAGQLIPRQQFEASVNQGWVSWSFDVFVKRPVSWSFGKVFGSGDNVQGEYVMVEVLKTKSQQLLQRFINDDSPGGNIIEMNDLLQRCGDICGDMDTLNLIVLQLVKEKAAVIMQTEKDNKVVRFVTHQKKTVAPISEVELTTLKLKKTEDYLKNQVIELSDDMERCKEDARFYLKKGLRNSAKNALRRKQTLGRMLAKRETALETVQNMMQQIHEAESHKKILDAYKDGASAFKEVAAKHNLTTDNIDEIMSDVQEVFDMQSEINDSMAYNPAESTLDYTTADLEEELSEILASESGQSGTTSDLNTVSSPMRNTKISPGLSGMKNTHFESNLPNVPSGGIYSDYGSPVGFSSNSPQRGTQYVSPSRSPRQQISQPDSGVFNRTFNLDDSSSLSQISGASSTLDSYGSSLHTSDADLIQELEALKVMEEMNLPEVPTFDPATPPRNTQRIPDQQAWPPPTKLSKSKMRPLTG